MMEMKTYAQCQDVIEKIKRAAAAAAQEVRRNFFRNVLRTILNLL
jgi:hypothetical protein